MTAALTPAQHRALAQLARRPGFVATGTEQVLLRLGLAEPIHPGSYQLQLTDAGRAAVAEPAPPHRPTRLQYQCLEAIGAGGRGYVGTNRRTRTVRRNLMDAGLVVPTRDDRGALAWKLTDAGHVALAEWIERGAGRR